jgi:hypothetical protein
MSNFWNTSDGELATQTTGTYEAPTGNSDPIPDGSSVKAVIGSAQWKSPRDNDSVEYVELEWSVVEPAEYVNRKVWTKLWIDDLDPSASEKDEAKAIKKRDSHKRMLAAIDANAGGKLAKRGVRPTDSDLALALMQRPMIIKVKEWAIGDAKGNWVCAVSSAKGGAVNIAEAAPKKAAPKPATGSAFYDDDSDIPF